MKKQTENKKQEIKGSNYLNLGLYAFAGLGIEALYAFLLEPALYGTTMENWNAAQMSMHWILTCTTWGIIAFALIKGAGTIRI